ncbi:hypothetical protein AK812_SmicGene44798 [Symbiodinium microadriaticum]|uniref:Uncharacterized protein n=1 Tax=Symbiodinium microadriaticum TaxID=2951 RepID=A0A1Q9BXK7_SYMMI|nr:hypothetical protein AK812_SmicGene44798 [Symbiodinium microadriaticum]
MPCLSELQQDFTPKQKWLGGFMDPITQTQDQLLKLMEERGFAKIGEQQIAWLARRAAAEVRRKLAAWLFTSTSEVPAIGVQDTFLLIGTSYEIKDPGMDTSPKHW